MVFFFDANASSNSPIQNVTIFPIWVSVADSASLSFFWLGVPYPLSASATHRVFNALSLGSPVTSLKMPNEALGVTGFLQETLHFF
jgi:hypothetical protein